MPEADQGESAVVEVVKAYDLLKDSRKTGTVPSAPPEDPANSYPVWRRASVPFARMAVAKAEKFARSYEFSIGDGWWRMDWTFCFCWWNRRIRRTRPR
jgi:hypothetical protein